MPDVHLFDNFIGPPGITPVTGDWHAYGVAFYCTQSFQVDALRYWAPTSTVSDHPVRLHFWDGETGAELGQRTVPDHNGLVGWKDVAFGTPLTCEAYHRYVISGDNGGSRHVAYVGVAPGTPDRLFWDSNPTVQSVTDGHDLYPNTTYTNWALLDAAMAPSGTPAPSPDYDTGIENAFVRWDSSGGDNTRPLGLPVLTKAVVDAINTTVNNIPEATDAPWVTALKLWQIAGALTDLEITAWNAFAKRAPNQLTGATGGGGSAFFSSDGRQVAQSAALTLDAATLALALKRDALVSFPGTPWVHTDTTTFDTDLAWPVEADLYVVTFSDLGSNRVNTVAAGVDVSYRLAWWTPLVGAFTHQRRFIDTPSAHLWYDGTRMPGLLLRSGAGGTGTVEAWTYD